MMGIKSSVTIDIDLQKKLKKLAIILGLTQGDIISKAVDDHEKKVLMKVEDYIDFPNDSDEKDLSNDSDAYYKTQLKKASEIVFKKDPKKKKEQDELYDGRESIDDYIIFS